MNTLYPRFEFGQRQVGLDAVAHFATWYRIFNRVAKVVVDAVNTVVDKAAVVPVSNDLSISPSPVERYLSWRQTAVSARLVNQLKKLFVSQRPFKMSLFGVCSVSAKQAPPSGKAGWWQPASKFSWLAWCTLIATATLAKSEAKPNPFSDDNVSAIAQATPVRSTVFVLSRQSTLKDDKPPVSLAGTIYDISTASAGTAITSSQNPCRYVKLAFSHDVNLLSRFSCGESRPTGNDRCSARFIVPFLAAV